MSKKLEIVVGIATIIGVLITAIALIPSFGEWLFPREPLNRFPQPTIEPTPTPFGQIFRDDFTESLQPRWIWLNENLKNWDFTEQGWLRIKSEDLCLYDDSYQNNLLMRNPPADEKFIIEAHIIANAASNFQQAGIYLFEDEDNFFSVLRGYCDICPFKGKGIGSDYKINSKRTNFNGRAINIDDVYLRIAVNYNKKEIIAYYATELDQWIQLRKIPITFNINQVGLGASNCDPDESYNNLVALFDYFEISILE